jgi:hypothetical protein
MARTGMGAYIAGPKEGELNKNVNARLEKFLEDLSKLPDFGKGQNAGNVDRRNLTLRFAEDIKVLREKCTEQITY